MGELPSHKAVIQAMNESSEDDQDRLEYLIDWIEKLLIHPIIAQQSQYLKSLEPQWFSPSQLAMRHQYLEHLMVLLDAQTSE